MNVNSNRGTQITVILSAAKNHVEYVRSLLIATNFEMPRDRSPVAQDDRV